MALQPMPLGKTGADSRRVLELLTPMTGTAAPAVHAIFIGQTFVDTEHKKVYVSVAIASTSAADDWVETTTVAAG